MAETFKRMESGHTEGDGWGIYAEYTSPICNMQCLMKTVLENSTPEGMKMDLAPLTIWKTL